MTGSFAPFPPDRSSPPPIRRRLRVYGIVQGVGFRPHVYTLATRLGLGGFVGNDSGGVFIELEGRAAALNEFQQELMRRPPPLAQIERIEVEHLAPHGETEFAIVASEGAAGASAQRTFIPPDQALCADCRGELFDPQDRRFRYPFVNCTNCGPRFTIIRGAPYDRPLTTMSGFPMCEACRCEYEDPGNRRFHAQPIACPVCGPQLTFRESHSAGEQPAEHVAAIQAANAAQVSRARTEDAIAKAQRVLRAGKVLAVKGLGGYHLACSAADEEAVALLRVRKGRAAKPFALMAASLEAVRRIAHVDEQEAALLSGAARPIVLLRKREQGELAAAVAPGNGYVGVMLPYTPLHELLFSAAGAGAPLDLLVMTSGNLSEEPITWRDDEALARLAPLADAFLLHDRPIQVPCDDSVVRIFGGRELPLRRARGYAPLPLPLPRAGYTRGKSSGGLLATGADLKSALCLAEDGQAIMSQHIGDMGNVATYDAFSHTAEHLQTLFRIHPEALACDAHPGYLSTRWAHEHAAGRPVIAVQHHHAHLAAVLAEHGVRSGDGDEAVIGFIFDGTGYGTDGAIWGGEVLVGGYAACVRRAHLRYIPLPGGDAAVRRPYRTALAHLWTAGVEWLLDLPPVRTCSPAELALLRRQLETGFQTVPSSSMGRLCDAVAALAGVCQAASYEAQAAIELEAHVGDNAAGLLDEEPGGSYAFGFTSSPVDRAVTLVDPAPLIRQVAADVRAGRSAAYIAAHFHAVLAAAILRLSRELRAETGINRVALSGGVFQNVVLLQAAVTALRRAGFTVLTHRRVPPNDGGLALGQAVIAARQLRLW